MFSRSLRAALEIPRAPFCIPTTTIRPVQRACLHQVSSSTQFHATPPEIPPQDSSANARQTEERQSTPQQSSTTTPPSTSTTPTIPANKTPIPPTFTSPLKLTPSLTTLLPHLATQTPHYITAHLHARPYLLTEGDTLRLPFHMPDVYPGDILRFNRASSIGSRDFTLKGAPYVDERLFECRVRILGTESEPMRIKEKTKRRQRHVRRVKSKHKFTLMRVMEVKVKGLDELIKEGAEVVKET